MKKKITEANLNLKEWKSLGPETVAKVKARNAALRAKKEAKDGKINMRLPSSDLEALQAAADKKGVGYQTLLGMIIHQYVSGTLIDIEEVKKVLKIESTTSTKTPKTA